MSTGGIRQLVYLRVYGAKPLASVGPCGPRVGAFVLHFEVGALNDDWLVFVCRDEHSVRTCVTASLLVKHDPH